MAVTFEFVLAVTRRN